MVHHSRFQYRFRPVRVAIAALTGAVLSVSCSSSTTNPLGTTGSQDGSAIQPLPAGQSPNSDLSAVPTFPQASCGDVASTPTENWYVVYIDGANIEDIRAKYCADAVSTVHPSTGEATIQVASFTDFAKATQFATAVGGTVEQLGPSATSSPTASPPGLTQPRLTEQNGQQPYSSTSPSPASGLATLRSQEPDSPINVRASASISAEVNSVGYPGDRVRVLSTSQGNDGFTWYNVQLEAGESGWVRGDLLSVGTGPSPSPSLGSSNVPSGLPPTTAPSTTAPSTTTPGADLGKTATLTATDPESPINVRSRASISSDIQDSAYPGDSVRVVGQAQGDDGATWYNVQFESGSRGWVRSDFINIQ